MASLMILSVQNLQDRSSQIARADGVLLYSLLYRRGGFCQTSELEVWRVVPTGASQNSTLLATFKKSKILTGNGNIRIQDFLHSKMYGKFRGRTKGRFWVEGREYEIVEQRRSRKVELFRVGATMPLATFDITARTDQIKLHLANASHPLDALISEGYPTFLLDQALLAEMVFRIERQKTVSKLAESASAIADAFSNSASLWSAFSGGSDSGFGASDSGGASYSGGDGGAAGGSSSC